MQVASVSGADWILNLEDDVHVLERIDLEGLRWDLNGDNPGVRLPGA